MIGVGKRSFTLLVPRLGLEKRLHVDVVDAGLLVEWKEEAQILTLSRARAADAPAGDAAVKKPWQRLELRPFVRLAVKLSCRAKPPLDVAIDILGPQRESPLARLDSSAAT